MEGPAPGRYRGTAAVRQSAFGITPYSGFFGALKLRDEIGVEFEVDTGRAAAQASTCGATGQVAAVDSAIVAITLPPHRAGTRHHP